MTEGESLSQYRSRIERELNIRQEKFSAIQDEINSLELKLRQERMVLEVIQGRSSLIQLKENYRSGLKKQLRLKKKELVLAADELKRALERWEAIREEEE